MKPTSVAVFLSFFVGAASLGQETLWIRLASFAADNSPQTLGIVLGTFLFGIVAGSLLGKRYCRPEPQTKTLLRYSAIALYFSAAVDILSPIALMLIDDDILIPLAMICMVFLASCSKAILFPIVHHLGGNSTDGKTGQAISRIYFSNILGATLSPLLIGFWLLDRISSMHLMMGIGFLTLLIAFQIQPWRSETRFRPVLQASTLGLIALLVLKLPPDTLLRHLVTGHGVAPLVFLHENRHGIIHVISNPQLGDTVYGGNLYDGRINIDPFLDSNGISRAYLSILLHPAPKRILAIGLSGGAWARVLDSAPSLERMDIVEINPGYLQLIRKYDLVRPVLESPRIHIHIDDGRRWLKRHEHARFDLIVMNNTYHWRAYASNLLSVEFMKILRRHLSPGGILAFNATGSHDVLATAAAVFRHAYRWKPSSFIYASDWDFRRLPTQEGRAILASMLRRLGMQSSSAKLDALHLILHPEWVSVADELQLAQRHLELITDDNMLTEYRRGKARIWPF